MEFSSPSTRNEIMGRIALALCLVLGFPALSLGAEMSAATAQCLDCHADISPAMVSAWKMSRHAGVNPAEALKKPERERRISAAALPNDLAQSSVGCAECHTRNPEKHADTFEHNGFQVHVVVSPQDCATCHPVEAKQYGENIMSHAYGNLMNNPMYRDMARVINGGQVVTGEGITLRPPASETEAEACLSCHGTRVEVKGTIKRDTTGGEMEFPVLVGWPNMGVGRLNPDGSKGSCAACHARHQFSIEVARKPHTCSQCHKGPDVPAYAVYQVSKHGNIYESMAKQWHFEAVPWTVGKDFTAPTCATCHMSLVVTDTGEVVAERSHQVNDRLAWRIFGPIYAHAHPKAPDTTIIRNRNDQPLPATFNGEPASSYLIDPGEQQKRKEAMQQVCMGCHTRPWVDGHWARFENTIRTTNEMTLAATTLIMQAWDKKLATGPSQGGSAFDEPIEKQWTEQWLFFGNSTRFSSAMLGADYGVFANGRWSMAKNLQQIQEWLRLRLHGK
jgi:hydroxylamine dehydrogenase